MTMVALHDDILPESPKAGTLRELLRGELAGGEGCPAWRDWVVRAAARHGVTPAA